tara:strand:+ start:3402 stop:4034 length:633 start_codon:yes stop_codon:yes gene_type:complete
MLLQPLPEEGVATLPNVHEIATLPLRLLLDALSAAASSADGETVAAACCLQLGVLAHRNGLDEAAAEAGAFPAVIAAMNMHRSSAAVQYSGCKVIANMCLGAHDPQADTSTQSRHTMALAAGSLASVVSALREHAATNADIIQAGIMALSVLIGRDGGLRQQAAAFGARAEWLDIACQIAGAVGCEAPSMDADMEEVAPSGGLLGMSLGE